MQKCSSMSALWKDTFLVPTYPISCDWLLIDVQYDVFLVGKEVWAKLFRMQTSQDFGSLVLRHLSNRVNYFLHISMVSDFGVSTLQTVRGIQYGHTGKEYEAQGVKVTCAANRDKSGN